MKVVLDQQAAVSQGLLHGQIQKITQPSPYCVRMEVYRQGARQPWLFSVHPQFPRIARTWKHYQNPPLPPLFCLWLRTRLLHAEFTRIDTSESQLWQLELQRMEETYLLVWEANGKHSNLLLLDKQQCLLTALHNPNQAGRVLKQTMKYQPPVKWEKLSKVKEVPREEKARDTYFWELEQTEEIATRSVQYRKHFKTLKKKLARRLEKQAQDLEHCQNAEQYRQWGELLKPHLQQIQPGQKQIEVTNYFEAAFPPMMIPLNPQNTPRENLAHLFHKADKLQKAIPHVEKRMRQTLQEQNLLIQQQEQLTRLESRQPFHSWEKTLPKFLKLPPSSSSVKAKGSFVTKEPLTRLSSDGLMIVVGRNKQQNAQVTFSMARGNDWWFHAQGIAGSHVIVKFPQRSLPPQTLLEAAQLAAYYCKARANRKIEVDYTQRKSVRKIKGAEPGMVTYSQNKTILIELNDSLLHQLLENE